MAKRKKKGIHVTNSRGETVIRTDANAIIDRKPKKGETIRIGQNVCIQNHGKVGHQTIVNLDTFNGDLYL